MNRPSPNDYLAAAVMLVTLALILWGLKLALTTLTK
jgi:hypothetical protein